MPYLELITNVQLDEQQQETLVKALSKAASQAIGKPESFMAVSYDYNKSLIHGGTSDPAFQIRLISIGLTVEKCPGLSAAIADVLKTVGLDASRGYMQLQDPTAERIGWKGTTFSEL